MSSHQDWSPIVVRRSELPGAPRPTETVKKVTGGINKQTDRPSGAMRKIEETESYKEPAKSTLEMANTIQRARLDKKPDPMSQQDLDKACGFPKGTVAAYENRTAIIIPTQTQKMSVVLGVPIKNPPKKKPT